jgi:hypothetical protein
MEEAKHERQSDGSTEVQETPQAEKTSIMHAVKNFFSRMVMTMRTGIPPYAQDAITSGEMLETLRKEYDEAVADLDAISIEKNGLDTETYKKLCFAVLGKIAENHGLSGRKDVVHFLEMEFGLVPRD